MMCVANNKKALSQKFGLCQADIGCVFFIVSFLAFDSSKLPFEFTGGQIDTSVDVLAGFATNKNLAVFGPRNNLHARIAARLAVDNYLYLIETIVVFGKLRSFFLCVVSDSFSYVDMLAGNCKKQNWSPL
jgi:hypothetical protein